MNELQSNLVKNIQKKQLNKSIGSPKSVIKYIKEKFLELIDPIQEDYPNLCEVYEKGNHTYLSIDEYELVLEKKGNLVNLLKLEEGGLIIFASIMFYGDYTYILYGENGNQLFFDEKQLEMVFNVAFEKIIKMEM